MAKNTMSPGSLIRGALQRDDRAEVLERHLDSVDPAELLHAVFTLDPDEQRKLLAAVSAERAADLVEELPGPHPADLIEEMPAQQAAPIVEELASGPLLTTITDMCGFFLMLSLASAALPRLI